MKSAFRIIIILVGLICINSKSFAQVTEPPVPAALPPEPLPSYVPKIRHGAYFRVALGGGYTMINETTPNKLSDDISGAGFALDLSVGGAVNPNLTLGCNFAFQQLSKPDIKVGNLRAVAKNDVNVGVLGFSVDAFSPNNGFHTSGTLGPGIVTVSNDSGDTTLTAKGVGLSWVFGYDARVGDSNVHLGVLGRFIAIRTTLDGSDQNSYAFAVMADILNL